MKAPPHVFRIILPLVVLLSSICLFKQAEHASSQSTAQFNLAADRVIDVHGHIGSYKGYDLDTTTLLSNIARYGVRLVLVSNIDGADLPGTTRNLDETAANQATVEIVRQNKDKLRGLVWTRPEDGAPAKIEPFLKDNKERIFVGMKIHPDMNHFPADDARVDGYLRLCAKYKLPAVFHSGKRNTDSDPTKIYAAARRHPRVPVILYHMGFGRDHAHAIAVAKEALTKKDAQLYVETAQAEPEAVLDAIKQLGADRVLFGTDATYYGKEHYARYEKLVALLKEKLAAKDYAKVMRGNAERLFKLK
jgi:uncharacterized protein